MSAPEALLADISPRWQSEVQLPPQCPRRVLDETRNAKSPRHGFGVSVIRY